MAIPSKKDLKYWLFLIVFVIVVIMFLRLLEPFIAPLILSAIIVSIFTPVYYFLNRWLPHSVASFICCGLICVIIFIPFVIIIMILANQALTLYSSAMDSPFMQGLIQEIDGNWIVAQVNILLHKLNLGFTITGDQIYQFIGRIGNQFVTFLYNQAANISSNFIRVVINFCFMILISYYLFGNGRRVISFFVGLSPLPDGQEVAVLQRLKTTAGAIFLGSFVSGVIQGTVGGLTLWYFGFPAPFLWAVVMVILAFLPIVGIGLVFVPCIVITFLGGDYVSGVIMSLIYVASSSITEYIIVPRLEGKRSQMHTVFVFLSVLGGLQLFGIIGVLYGPLIITAFLALYEIYNANYAATPAGTMPMPGDAAVVPAAATTPFVPKAHWQNIDNYAAVSDPAEDDVPVRDGAGKDISTAADPGPAWQGAGESADQGIVMGAPTTPAVGADKPIECAEALEGNFDQTDDNVALGDDVEPEFHADTGAPVDDVLGIHGGLRIGEVYGADKGEFNDYPGHSYVDYPGGRLPSPCAEEDLDGPDGLIWNDARPAHLPFPKAEGADCLIPAEDTDEYPDVSIKDIVKADINSFDMRDDEIMDEEQSSEDKTTKE